MQKDIFAPLVTAIIHTPLIMLERYLGMHVHFLVGLSVKVRFVTLKLWVKILISVVNFKTICPKLQDCMYKSQNPWSRSLFFNSEFQQGFINGLMISGLSSRAE